ncbi:MAG: hypothetical protein GXY48_08285 [Methanomicrobiales archaeon]|nr:hypothetical protein [Methanomicrobiales archaeon]
MREKISLQFSERDEEIAVLFHEIGILKNSSRVLTIAIRGKEFTAREMERICDLRQPEVSIAIKDLISKKWIKITRNWMEKKGRPVLVYRLNKELDDILDDIKGNILGSSGRKIIDIERVRELIRSQQSEFSYSQVTDPLVASS